MASHSSDGRLRNSTHAFPTTANVLASWSGFNSRIDVLGPSLLKSPYLTLSEIAEMAPFSLISRSDSVCSLAMTNRVVDTRARSGYELVSLRPLLLISQSVMATGVAETSTTSCHNRLRY